MIARTMDTFAAYIIHQQQMTHFMQHAVCAINDMISINGINDDI